MYNEETKSSRLAQFLSEFDYVFVDTCSLMEDTFPKFMDYLKSSKEYWKEGLEVVILGEVLEELKTNSKKKNDETCRIGATRALKIIKHDKWHGKTLTISKGKKGKSFGDQALYTAVSALRIEKKILVITQDRTLTADLLKLNRLESQKGRYLKVYRINEDSELEMNPGDKDSRSIKKHAPSYNDKPRKDNNFRKEEKTTTISPSKKLSNGYMDVLKYDSILSANLSNANYKVESKIKDIDEQIKRIDSLSKEENSFIKLTYSKDALIAKKKELGKNLPKKVEEPKKEVKKQEPKEQKKKVYYEYGKTPSEALKRLAIHYGVLVRDPSVAYWKEVHGRFDLTDDDLKKVDSLYKGMAFNFKKGNDSFSFEKKNNDISVYLVENLPVIEEKVEKKIENPVKTPLEDKKPKQEPKKEKPAKAEKKPEPKKEKEPVSKKKEEALLSNPKKKIKVLKPIKADSVSAVPEGVRLVGGEPKSLPKKTMKPIISEKPKLLKDNTAQILKNDKILNANLNNPNYPKEKAIKLLNEQKALLKASKSKPTELQYDLAKIDKKLSELNKKK